MSPGRSPKNDFPLPPAAASLAALGWAAVVPEMVAMTLDEARRPPRDAWHRRLRQDARVIFGWASHVIGSHPGLHRTSLYRGISRTGLLATYAAIAKRIV